MTKHYYFIGLRVGDKYATDLVYSYNMKTARELAHKRAVNRHKTTDVTITDVRRDKRDAAFWAGRN